MSLPVAIVAGGLATRLHPITQKIPKSLIDVAGKPFVVRQLDYLQRQGITRVVLCLGYLGEQVEAVVSDGSAFGLGCCLLWFWRMLQPKSLLIWRTSITNFRLRACWRATRCLNDFMKLAPTRGWKKLLIILKRKKHELRPAAFE